MVSRAIEGARVSIEPQITATTAFICISRRYSDAQCHKFKFTLLLLNSQVELRSSVYEQQHNDVL